MEQKLSKQRDSNFELLRILAMFGIVLAHMNGHGVWFPEVEKSGLNFILHETIFGPLGAIGNWLFIFISGYFISAASFSWKKLFRLWFQVFSISAVIGIVTWYANIVVIPVWDSELSAQYAEQGFFAVARHMTRLDLAKSLLPSYWRNNWFAAAYMVFFLIMPLLDMFVSRISQKELLRTIIILCVACLIIPVIPYERFFEPSIVSSFIVGFFIAKYIRLYTPPPFSHAKRNMVYAVLLCGILIVYPILCDFLFSHIAIPLKYQETIKGVLNQQDSIIVMLCALCIFCVFRSLKFPHNRVINLIASTTFGVYLIHENLLINKWWWHVVCKLDDWITSPYLIGYMLLCAVVTFAICSVIELARKYCIEKPLFALVLKK